MVDLDGRVRGYDVRYQGFEGIGSGDPIPLRGTDLVISVNAPAYGGNGQATYEFDDPRELVDVDGCRTFRQVAWGGSFEARTSIGLGVRLAAVPGVRARRAGPGITARRRRRPPVVTPAAA